MGETEGTIEGARGSSGVGVYDGPFEDGTINGSDVGRDDDDSNGANRGREVGARDGVTLRVGDNDGVCVGDRGGSTVGDEVATVGLAVGGQVCAFTVPSESIRA